MRLLSLLPLLVLSACCDGPLVFADCVGDSVRLQVVDENGDPLPVDTVRWVGAGRMLWRCDRRRIGAGGGGLSLFPRASPVRFFWVRS
jgi:hypothetical protein